MGESGRVGGSSDGLPLKNILLPGFNRVEYLGRLVRCELTSWAALATEAARGVHRSLKTVATVAAGFFKSPPAEQAGPEQSHLGGGAGLKATARSAASLALSTLAAGGARLNAVVLGPISEKTKKISALLTKLWLAYNGEPAGGGPQEVSNKPSETEAMYALLRGELGRIKESNGLSYGLFGTEQSGYTLAVGDLAVLQRCQGQPELLSKEAAEQCAFFTVTVKEDSKTGRSLFKLRLQPTTSSQEASGTQQAKYRVRGDSLDFLVTHVVGALAKGLVGRTGTNRARGGNGGIGDVPKVASAAKRLGLEDQRKKLAEHARELILPPKLLAPGTWFVEVTPPDYVFCQVSEAQTLVQVPFQIRQEDGWFQKTTAPGEAAQTIQELFHVSDEASFNRRYVYELDVSKPSPDIKASAKPGTDRKALADTTNLLAFAYVVKSKKYARQVFFVKRKGARPRTKPEPESKADTSTEWVLVSFGSEGEATQTSFTLPRPGDEVRFKKAEALRSLAQTIGNRTLAEVATLQRELAWPDLCSEVRRVCAEGKASPSYLQQKAYQLVEDETAACLAYHRYQLKVPGQDGQEPLVFGVTLEEEHALRFWHEGRSYGPYGSVDDLVKAAKSFSARMRGS